VTNSTTPSFLTRLYSVMKILLLLWMGMLPLLGVGQARTRMSTERIPVGEYGSEFTQRSGGANELLLVTPDSLAEALHKMQQLVESKGYTLAAHTATMLTTTSKYVHAGLGESVVVRKWFFFHKWKPAPNPPVSFRFRVRAFALPTGTQLQLVGVYIHEGCAECVGADECPGQEMHRYFEPAHMPGSRVSVHQVTFREIWEEICFEEALNLARQYSPSTLDLVQVHRYTTSGVAAW
jgi:hypothetical protein